MDFEDCIADASFNLFKNENKLNVINPHLEIETLEITKKDGKNLFFSKWEEQLKDYDPNYNINLKFEENSLFKYKQERIGK